MAQSVRKVLQQQAELEDAPPAKNPDADVMVGGPGQDDITPPTETAPAAPEVREVKINGRTFQVPVDLAQTLEQRERDFDRTLNEKLSARDRELQALRTQVPKPEPQRPNYDTLLFENPGQAVQMLKQEIRQELTGMYQAEKGLDLFWRDFYRNNQDISENEDGFIVKAILNEHLNELAPMKSSEAAKELADMSRRELLRIAQKHKIENDGKTPSRTIVEPASHTAPRSATREPEEPMTLSAVIRARRKARMGKSANA